MHLAHIGHPLIGDPIYGRAPRSRTKTVPTAVVEALRAFETPSGALVLKNGCHCIAAER